MSSGECKESILFKLFSIFFTYQSIQCNPCPVRKHLLHVSTHLFGFSHSLSGICQWELPSANTFFSTVCWSRRGALLKGTSRKGEDGTAERRRRVSILLPCWLTSSWDSNQKPSNRRLPSASPSGHCLPEGLCDSGLLKKCLQPWKKKKSADFPHSREFKQV